MTRRGILTLPVSAAAGPSRRKGRIRIAEYRVLYDGQPQGYYASAIAIVRDGSALALGFAKASDAAAGTLPFLTVSRDEGRTWTPPRRFGTELPAEVRAEPDSSFLGVMPFGPTKRGTLLAVGFHTRKPVREGSYRADVRWRPGSFLLGRRERGETAFQYRVYPSGSFLGEQFAAGGLVTRSGRIVLTMWGAREQGRNWECGVLLSDDDGRSWRYRVAGPPVADSFRDDPDMPVGFNEQTLFEPAPGKLVSIIRARAKLGRLPDSPKDTWYFRSESNDGGETWSSPDPTNLAGTGAPPSGITLPDGSLLTASRVPYSRMLYALPKKDLFGLHLVRSLDGGRTWRTESLIQQDPEGGDFDNHYNAMNGQFLRLARGEWLYVFGEFRAKLPRHRALMLRLRYEEGS